MKPSLLPALFRDGGFSGGLDLSSFREGFPGREAGRRRFFSSVPGSGKDRERKGKER